MVTIKVAAGSWFFLVLSRIVVKCSLNCVNGHVVV